jgi:hypothetical protein
VPDLELRRRHQPDGPVQADTGSLQQVGQKVGAFDYRGLVGRQRGQLGEQEVELFPVEAELTFGLPFGRPSRRSNIGR